jgi:hypothetical protein
MFHRKISICSLPTKAPNFAQARRMLTLQLPISFARKFLNLYQQIYFFHILKSWHSMRPNLFKTHCQTVRMPCLCFHIFHTCLPERLQLHLIKFLYPLCFDGWPYPIPKIPFDIGCEDAIKGCRVWLYTCQLHLLESF